MTLLEFPKQIPRWRQIADSLGRDLREAQFADGRLPTEETLARRFGVNRHTVRRAIAALAGQGLVRVEHGRGTFVGGYRADGTPPRRSRYTLNVTNDGDGLHRRLIRATRGTAGTQIAKDFGIAVTAAIIEIETVAEFAGAALNFEVHRFRADRGLTLPYAFMLGLSIADAFKASGTGNRKLVAARLSARLSSDAEARYLEQAASLPVLQIERVHVDARGVPVHCSTSIFPADRIEVVLPTPNVIDTGHLPERIELPNGLIKESADTCE
jgi:GntR family transcriptional regulator, phosphonate transport system regulatory protein